MTHTPGPWRLVKDDYIMSHKGLLIGQICSEDATNMDANARLIAAAPDLLAALREVIGHPISIDMGDDESLAPLWAQVRAAIAKAEGR